VRARLRDAVLVLACVATLAACSGGGDVDTSTDPVEVEVGQSFSWNGFVVDDGWELNPIKRSAGFEEVTTPEVKGTITNTSDEERAAIFQMVFSADGDALATLNCTAGKMLEDQSRSLVCPGLSATMPDDYDAVVVQEFTRDTSSS
jgi:ABC-type glycerol-3-phosphate transport system substrate-binding protein